jgi:hypothetical protein
LPAEADLETFQMVAGVHRQRADGSQLQHYAHEDYAPLRFNLWLAGEPVIGQG